MENITQGEDTLELKVFIHNYQTVDARFANGVEYGVQSVIQRAGVDARELLQQWLVDRVPVKVLISRTYRRTLLEYFSNRETQIIVNAAPDQGNDIDRLEYIVHNA